MSNKVKFKNKLYRYNFSVSNFIKNKKIQIILGHEKAFQYDRRLKMINFINEFISDQNLKINCIDIIS